VQSDRLAVQFVEPLDQKVEDHESTEYEEDNVAEQRHGDYFTNVLREKRQSCPIAEMDKSLCVNIAWRRRESS
jgi:hypothetical protein